MGKNVYFQMANTMTDFYVNSIIPILCEVNVHISLDIKYLHIHAHIFV